MHGQNLCIGRSEKDPWVAAGSLETEQTGSGRVPGHGVFTDKQLMRASLVAKMTDSMTPVGLGCTHSV